MTSSRRTSTQRPFVFISHSARHLRTPVSGRPLTTLNCGTVSSSILPTTTACPAQTFSSSLTRSSPLFHVYGYLFAVFLCLTSLIYSPVYVRSFSVISRPNSAPLSAGTRLMHSPTQRHTAPVMGFELNFGNDRVALVTGASRGIGKTTAETLGKSGVSKVICVAKSYESCLPVVDSLQAMGCEAAAYGVDVSVRQEVHDVCERVLDTYGKVDILVNNAGITRDNLFIRMSPEEWEDVINTNLNSVFYFTSPIIKKMLKNKWGRIINMSSVVGVGGNAGQANYAAAKAGMIGFTRALAKEYGNRGITSNAIAPGFITSAMTDQMTAAAKEATIAQIPMKRMGTQQDVANTVAFLASDEAAYITGKVIPVDGGMLFGGN